MAEISACRILHPCEEVEVGVTSDSSTQEVSENAESDAVETCEEFDGASGIMVCTQLLPM